VGGALTGVFLFALGVLHAQQATPKAEAYVPKQSDRPSALSSDEPGFEPIFDGKTLTGWEGN